VAVTYPRTMLCGVQQASFTIGRPMAVNRLNGGVTQVRELGEPRWVASFTYAGSKRLQFQAVQAWVDSLRGGLQLFYGHDALKPYPASYPGGVGLTGWGGTGTIIGLAVDSIGVTGTIANMKFKAGDMVGLSEGTKRGLFRIVEDVTFNPAGSGVLFVEPRVSLTLFTALAIVNFFRPVCTMVLDPGSVSATQTAWGPSSVGFGGVQQVI